MKLDLRKDRVAILKYVKMRIRDYPVYVNAGPGADEDPITQITLGYQFDQAGWAALVFDTRTHAKVDGEWQGYIEENELPVGDWLDVYEKIYVDEGISSFGSLNLLTDQVTRSQCGRDCCVFRSVKLSIGLLIGCCWVSHF